MTTVCVVGAKPPPLTLSRSPSLSFGRIWVGLWSVRRDYGLLSLDYGLLGASMGAAGVPWGPLWGPMEAQRSPYSREARNPHVSHRLPNNKYIDHLRAPLKNPFKLGQIGGKPLFVKLEWIFAGGAARAGPGGLPGHGDISPQRAENGVYRAAPRRSTKNPG